MRKSELKGIIKEVICEGGFLDTLSTLISPGGKAREMTKKSLKSKKIQDKIGKVIDSIMQSIISSSTKPDDKSNRNDVIVKKILENTFLRVSNYMNKKGISSPSEFISEFSKMNDINNYIVTKNTLKSTNTSNEKIDKEFSRLKNDILIFIQYGK